LTFMDFKNKVFLYLALIMQLTAISKAEQYIVFNKRGEGLFLYNPVLNSSIKVYSYLSNNELADLKTLRQRDNSTTLLNEL